MVALLIAGLQSSAAATQNLGAALFADLCGAVGGADNPPPAYPVQPTPTGDGTVVSIDSAADLDDLLSGRTARPAPGSVISVASGVYSEARWKSTGGRGIGFAGTAQDPITWYAREQHGVEITTSSSYRAMQLNASDAHHRFIGFHLRDGHELFLSLADGTDFLHGRVSGSTSGGAWKWRGPEGGPAANGMRFMYNVVSTANGGGNFGRLEGVYIGDGRHPQLLNTRQTNFEISHNCFLNAPGGAIDIKANSTNGVVANNLIDSTDDISGGINALPGWHWLPASVRSVNPNMRSEGNRISVRAHPDSSDSNAGAGIRVNGTWRSQNDRIFNSSNSALFVLAQADLHLTVTGLTSLNNANGAATRGGRGQVNLQSEGNVVDQQGNLILQTAPAPPPTTTTTSPPTTRPTPTTTNAPPTTRRAPGTTPPSTAPSTTLRSTTTTSPADLPGSRSRSTTTRQPAPTPTSSASPIEAVTATAAEQHLEPTEVPTSGPAASEQSELPDRAPVAIRPNRSSDRTADSKPPDPLPFTEFSPRVQSADNGDEGSASSESAEANEPQGAESEASRTVDNAEQSLIEITDPLGSESSGVPRAIVVLSIITLAATLLRSRAGLLSQAGAGSERVNGG